MSAGDLDLSFGNRGTAYAIFGEGLKPVAEDVAVQADGKTVVAGYTWYFDAKNNPHYQLAVARFNQNGTLDKTFGPDGTGKIQVQVADTDSAQGRSVAIQPDGKILVAGSAESGGKDVMAVVRFNSDGSLDNTFDKDGKATGRINDSVGYDMALQSDGRIVVAGSDYSGFFNANDDFAVIRLNPNGSLDKSFDGDGKATVKMGANERALAVAIDYSGTPQSNSNYGKIVLAGEYRTDQFRQYAVARLTAGGKLDEGFAQGGWMRAGFNGHVQSHARSVVVQPNGKIVIAGTGGDEGSSGSFQFTLARFDKKGKLDPIFGTNGIVETGFGGTDIAHDVILSADDGLIVGGGVNRKFALAKYNSIGQLDTRFGNGGKVSLDAGEIDAGAGLASTRDGRVVMAGGYNFVAARLSQGLPTVNIINGDRDAAEKPDDDGSLVISLDSTYDFPTRVYLEVSGDASFDLDYTAPITRVRPVVNGGRVLRAAPIGGPLGDRLYYVDIPAGQLSLTVPIDARNDYGLEPAEIAKFTIAPNERYTIGSFKDRTVTIADDDGIQVNFQTRPDGPINGKLFFDAGYTYRDQGEGLHFGWDADNRANARVRNNAGSPNALYDTLNHMQKNGNRKWEFAVQDGLYEVTLIAGDPSNTDSVYKMNLENTLVLSGKPSGNTRWFYSIARVQVNDGRLTLTNAPGAVNNRVCYIEINAAAPNKSAGPVVSNVPVQLVGKTMISEAVTRMAHTFSAERMAELVLT
jgi:uncharacterized delta-60 repeat protein